MKLAIIREGKVPSDSRTPLTPDQCAFLRKQKKVDLVVQSSEVRAYKDREYEELGVPVVEDISDREVLLGVKEVPVDQLLPHKTYFFFSHTIKKQEYNKGLLQAILKQGIRLIDYEVLTNEQGARVIAFGTYAGMVGAHNALWTYGQRTKLFQLTRMKDLKNYEAARAEYEKTVLPDLNIVLTGTGRVGRGAATVLRDMGINQVSAQQFLKDSTSGPCFTQIDAPDYARHKDGKPFELAEYFDRSERFESDFQPYYKKADIMINGIYWDNKAPAFFSAEEMQKPDFRIQVISDVTCDIAPVSSIPSTLKASTIADPVFGYDPIEKKITVPYQEDGIDMMTIDNLPNEMPRDASEGFGKQFIEHVIPALMNDGFQDRLLLGATIAENGHLGPHFEYLRDWLMA